METMLDRMITYMVHDLRAARAELTENKDMPNDRKQFLLGRISVLKEYISRFNTGVAVSKGE
jgi:hypothetical protein